MFMLQRFYATNEFDVNLKSLQQKQNRRKTLKKWSYPKSNASEMTKKRVSLPQELGKRWFASVQTASWHIATPYLKLWGVFIDSIRARKIDVLEQKNIVKVET